MARRRRRLFIDYTAPAPYNDWSVYNRNYNTPNTSFAPSMPTTPAIGSNGRLISIVTLDSTRVLMIYRGASAYTYARVASIDSNGFTTYGTEVTIESLTQSDICSCLIDSTHVVMGLQSANTVKLLVLEVNGTTITTVGAITPVFASNSTKMSITAISATEILLYFRGTGSGAYAYVWYASISGTTVTVGNPLGLGTISVYSDGYLTYIGGGYAVLAYMNATNLTGFAILITVNGNTPQTNYAGVRFDPSTNIVSMIRGVKIADNKLLIAYYNGTASKIQTAIITNDNGNLSISAATNIYNASSVKGLDLCKINDGYAAVSFGVTSVGLYSAILNISGNTVPTPTVQTQLLGSYDYVMTTAVNDSSVVFGCQDLTNTKGACLTMMRQLPFASSGMALWIDANDSAINTISSGAFSTIKDKSGNNYDVTQATSTYRPTYVTNVLNSKSIARFNGSNQYMSAPSSFLPSLTASNQGITVFVVCSCTVVQNSSVFASSPAPASPRINAHIPEADGTLYWDYGDVSGGGRAQGAWGGSTGVPYVWTFESSGTSAQNVYRNGTDIITTGSANLPTFTTSYSLCFGVAGDFGGYYNGDIAEVLIYSRPLNGTEITGVQNYLKTKYNITF